MKFDGAKIHELRTGQHLSLYQLAIKMGNIVTPMAINNWERGKTSPEASKLGMLAKALDVDIAYFFVSC